MVRQDHDQNEDVKEDLAELENRLKAIQKELDDDGDKDNGGGDKWDLWNFLPHAVTAMIAVAGVFLSLIWTLSDLKVRDMEMGTKIVYLESRVQHIEDSLGQRANTSDSDRKDLWNQVEDIKGTLKNIEEQHNRNGVNHR